MEVLLCQNKLPICWSKAMKVGGEKRCQISVETAWDENGRTLQDLFQERRSLVCSFKSKIKREIQWEIHVKAEQVCCRFINERQAQVLFREHSNLSFHVLGTPAGHWVDMWQYPRSAQASVRDGIRLSALTQGLSLLFFQHGMHMKHPLSLHYQLRFSAALQELSPVVLAGGHAGRYVLPCWNKVWGVQGKPAFGAGTRLGIRVVSPIWLPALPQTFCPAVAQAGVGRS